LVGWLVGWLVTGSPSDAITYVKCQISDCLTE